jgi:hypothetical protein
MLALDEIQSDLLPQREVFDYDWADITVPTEEEFEAARNAMTQGTNLQPSELATPPSLTKRKGVR